MSRRAVWLEKTYLRPDTTKGQLMLISVIVLLAADQGEGSRGTGVGGKHGRAGYGAVMGSHRCWAGLRRGRSLWRRGRRSGRRRERAERGDRDGGWPVRRREAAPHHVAAMMEDAQCRFGQLFVVVEMDGGQGGDVQVPLLVAAGKVVVRSGGGKMLLLLAAGTENTAVTMNK